MKEGTSAFDKRKIVGKKNPGVRRDIVPRLWLGWSGGYGGSKTEKT